MAEDPPVSGKDKHQDAIAYLQSWAAELKSQALRVRQLIGASHWPSDGAHKEVLLQSMIRRYLPPHLLVGRGFVVAPEHGHASSEQDVLVVDTSKESPLFYTDSLLICLPSQVVAGIAVKSSYRSDALRSALDSLRSLRLSTNHELSFPAELWTAVCFFDDPPDNLDTRAKEISSAVSKKPAPRPLTSNHMHDRAGPDLVFETFGNCYTINYEMTPDGERSVHTTVANHEGLGPALAMASLMDHVAYNAGAKRSAFANTLESIEWPAQLVKSDVFTC